MGCTVGAVLTKQGSILAFKTLDVKQKKRVPNQPVIIKSKRYQYLKFASHLNVHQPGLWAGINKKGVTLLGADACSTRIFTGKEYGGKKELEIAYEKALGETGTAQEALALMIQHFQDKKIGLDGDIILLVDRKQAIAAEYSLNEWGLQFADHRNLDPLKKSASPGIEPNPYLVRTNFYLTLRHLRHLPQENSIYLSALKRYERALDILSKTSINTTANDLKTLCRDHHPNPSGMSICAHGAEGEPKTIGSVIIELNTKKIKIHYLVGINPCQGNYQTISW